MDQGLIWGSSRGEERRGKQRERRRKEHTPLENPKTMFSYLFNVTFSFLLKTLLALCLCHFLKLASAHTIKHRHMHIFIKERSLYGNAILCDFLCVIYFHVYYVCFGLSSHIHGKNFQHVGIQNI